MKKIVYVSRKTDAARRDPDHVRHINELALIRNAGLLVTGALVATENRFAQVLEGPNANVDTLMVSILRDPRHTAINVIRDTPIRRRTFPKWSLAYVGPSTYVQGLIQPMLAEPFTTAQTDKLVRLMREFAREGG